MVWYTSRIYYRISLAIPIIFGLLLAVYTLVIDEIQPCSDPFGITEQCINSKSCNIEHCILMECQGKEMCVPEVRTVCFIERDVLSPGSCPTDHYPYTMILTSAFILIVVCIALLYICTRIFIGCKANKTYDMYPSLSHPNGGDICPTCGTQGVTLAKKCTNCHGSGMQRGTLRAIECQVCNGTGRVQGITPV